MLSLKQLPIKSKLAAMVAPASILLLIVSTFSLIENKNVMDESQRIDALVTFTATGSSLVHELQKERGASAGFLGSKGTSMRDTLVAQRRHTDEQLNAWLRQLTDIQGSIANSKMLDDLEKAKNKLEALQDVRSRVDRLGISVADAVSFFTLTNTYFIDSVLSVSQITSDSKIAASLFGFYNFISSKERAGIERAVLSGTFAAEQFAPGMYKRLIELITEQSAYMKPFLDSASAEQVAFYQSAMNSPAVALVKKMREIADSKATTGNFGVAATEWFRAATSRINELKRVEDKLTKDLLQETAGIYSSASTIFYALLITLIILFTSLAFLLSALYKLLNSQISAIVKTMQQVSTQNTLAIKCEQVTEDELGQLAKSFNHMLESFACAMDEMGKASEQLAAASEETNQVLESNKEMLQNQHLNSDQVATASEQMTHTVHEVAKNTNEAASKSYEINDEAMHASKVVQANSRNVEVLSTEVERIGSMIGRMHENSANITNVVEVIKSIAEQINLLALNAAIEAARAGDQGRGFAVVADEVRSLAIRTQDSTSEIDSIINQFRSATDDAFNAIKSGTEQAESVSKDTKSVEKILTGIVTSVGDIGSMMEQIATATSQQSATTEEINRSITEINSGTSAAAESAEQLQAVGQEQAHLAVRMQELATAYKV